MKNFFINENDFRVWLPEVQFIEKSDSEKYNSRQIIGIMNTGRVDRQGETIFQKGLDFQDFMSNGHFNDNHSQETSAIVGYPEESNYHRDLGHLNKSLEGVEGWTCRGYIVKGTKRSEGIWELAKALEPIPDKKLGFSIEGKVIRRKNKTIEKARIRNLAITNCPVNTDSQWNVLAKSFYDEETAFKAMSAGFATSPSTQSGGGALRSEDLDSDAKEVSYNKKKRLKKLMRALEMDELVKAMDFVLEERPDFTEEAAAYFVANFNRRTK